MKIQVSHNTFAEIETAMAAQNVKINQNASNLTIEKGSVIEAPTNFKLVTIRRDCADIAAKSYNANIHGPDFIEYTHKLYNFIMDEMPVETKKGGW